MNSIIYNDITDQNSYYYLNPRSEIGNKRFYFDNSKKKYVFNIIEIKLPPKVNKLEITDLKFKGNFNLYFITDVKTAFDNPSHYKINFGNTYSNIYSVRLVSSEIPNTAYSFNGIQLTTDIGKNKLSSKINNRLRWINKDDRYLIDNCSLSQLKFYADLKPIYKSIESRSEFQTNQDNFNKQSLNINLHSLFIYASSLKNINLVDINLSPNIILNINNSTGFNRIIYNFDNLTA